jgi:hypothetical protein
VEKREGNRLLGGPRLRLEGNIEMVLKVCDVGT